MIAWLMIAAAFQAAANLGSGAAMPALAPPTLAPVAKVRALDFRLKHEQGVAIAPPLVRGMIVQHEVAPNAAVGIGLSSLYDRRRNGLEQGGGAPKRSRKPAVSFVLKF